ncbi:hypothetical protein CFRS1_v000584 [Colletotrichum fructicola]|nr:hypothetical protein CFRS1_v000584 [Colletotrichum fructicola]
MPDLLASRYIAFGSRQAGVRKLSLPPSVPALLRRLFISPTNFDFSFPSSGSIPVEMFLVKLRACLVGNRETWAGLGLEGAWFSLVLMAPRKRS